MSSYKVDKVLGNDANNGIDSPVRTQLRLYDLLKNSRGALGSRPFLTGANEIILAAGQDHYLPSGKVLTRDNAQTNFVVAREWGTGTDINNQFKIKSSLSGQKANIAFGHTVLGKDLSGRSPIGFWELSPANPLDDLSAAGNNLTAQGAPITAPGDIANRRFGNGWSGFNGVDNYLTSADALLVGDQDFTIHLRVRSVRDGTTEHLIGQNDGTNNDWEIRHLSSGNYQFRINGSASTNLANPSAGGWFNIVITRIAGGLYVFINGVCPTGIPSDFLPLNFADAIPDNGTVLSIGARGDGTAPFSGDIDCVSIWDSGMDLDEAIALSNGGLSVGSVPWVEDLTQFPSGGVWRHPVIIDNIGGPARSHVRLYGTDGEDITQTGTKTTGGVDITALNIETNDGTYFVDGAASSQTLEQILYFNIEGTGITDPNNEAITITANQGASGESGSDCDWLTLEDLSIRNARVSGFSWQNGDNGFAVDVESHHNNYGGMPVSEGMANVTTFNYVGHHNDHAAGFNNAVENVVVHWQPKFYSNRRQGWAMERGSCVVYAPVCYDVKKDFDNFARHFQISHIDPGALVAEIYNPSLGSSEEAGIVIGSLAEVGDSVIIKNVVLHVESSSTGSAPGGIVVNTSPPAELAKIDITNVLFATEDELTTRVIVYGGSDYADYAEFVIGEGDIWAGSFDGVAGFADFTNDLHLTEASQAIGYGPDIAGAYTDNDGFPYTNPSDLGAYVFIKNPSAGVTLTNPYNPTDFRPFKGDSGILNFNNGNWTGATSFEFYNLPSWCTQDGTTANVNYSNASWGTEGNSSDNKIGDGLWDIQVKAISSNGLMFGVSSVWLRVEL